MDAIGAPLRADKPPHWPGVSSLTEEWGDLDWQGRALAFRQGLDRGPDLRARGALRSLQCAPKGAIDASSMTLLIGQLESLEDPRHVSHVAGHAVPRSHAQPPQLFVIELHTAVRPSLLLSVDPGHNLAEVHALALATVDGRSVIGLADRDPDDEAQVRGRRYEFV